MAMVVDNFKLVRDNILRFDNKGDFFFVLILRRRKDTKGKMLEGVNEDNRLIKHFFVYSKEYFDKKRDVIRALCEQNDARAYILPQRRNEVTVLCSILVKVVSVIVERLTNVISELFKTHKENRNLRKHLRRVIEGGLSDQEKHDIIRRLDAYDEMDRKSDKGDGKSGIHFDHLIRSCVAGCHKSDRTMWVIDIDRDSTGVEWTDEKFNDWVYDIVDDITEIRRKRGQKIPYELTIIPTPNGAHIVTEPFDISLFSMSNDMVKKDGMTLVYSNI